MIETIVSVQLPIKEELTIKKNRLTPNEMHGNEKRFCIVSGLYGDELGGQYICGEVIRRIKEHYDHLKGIVDVLSNDQFSWTGCQKPGYSHV